MSGHMATENGYSGIKAVNMTPERTHVQITILVTRIHQNILGDRNRDLTTLIEREYNFQKGSVEVTLTF